MATNANPNNFNLSGFVAVSATIKSFENSSVARFPLSISRKDTVDGVETRKSALINCECWAKNADSARFALLQKGTLVTISGYLKPDEYVDRNGQKQQRIIFCVTSVSSPTKSLGSAKNPGTSDAAPEKKAPKGKTKNNAA